MERKIVSMRIDAIFKKFFMEHEEMLRAFISDILDIPLDENDTIQIMNPEMPPETDDAKFSRLDLCLNVKNQLIDVEIQLSRHKDYRERTLFYWAKLYVSGLKKGSKYKDLKRTIAVNILDFNIFPRKKAFHTEIVATDKNTHELFSDKFSIHFFELKKANIDEHQPPEELDRKEVWMELIRAESEEELEKVRRTGMPIMQEAVRIVYDMSADAKVRELARWREKVLLDKESALDEARTEGEAKRLVDNVKTLLETT